ncbi:MAG: DUF4235 domain-containing protein [Candidatus Nanopelagicales bacterium]
MSDDLELPDVDDDELIEASTALKVAAPLIALGAGFLVRKVLDTAYEKTTGAPPPKAADRDVRLGRVLVYAAATAMAIAFVNVAVDRMTAPKRVTRA